jgi:cbb3-type cytochrome oxidase subunit 3
MIGKVYDIISKFGAFVTSLVLVTVSALYFWYVYTKAKRHQKDVTYAAIWLLLSIGITILDYELPSAHIRIIASTGALSQDGCAIESLIKNITLAW